MTEAEGREGPLVDINTAVLRKGRILIHTVPGAVFFLGFASRAESSSKQTIFDGGAESFIDNCRRIANSIDNGALVKAGYNPDETRAPAGNGRESGEWQTGQDGVAETAAKLPPGKRIDELGDLLEWIANARPEDATTIRSEIKRLYYDVGDTQGGNALNTALSDALEPGLNNQDRQEILDSIERYARSDPAEVAQFGRDLVIGSLLFPQSAVSAAPAMVASDVWKLGWAARGQQIEAELGANLPANFPTIDRFVGGVATSIKSIDLDAAVYQNANRLSTRINTYVDQVAKFAGESWGSRIITSGEITGRALNLAIPKGSVTAVQRVIFDAARVRASNLGVTLTITPF